MLLIARGHRTHFELYKVTHCEHVWPVWLVTLISLILHEHQQPLQGFSYRESSGRSDATSNALCYTVNKVLHHQVIAVIV